MSDGQMMAERWNLGDFSSCKSSGGGRTDGSDRPVQEVTTTTCKIVSRLKLEDSLFLLNVFQKSPNIKEY